MTWLLSFSLSSCSSSNQHPKRVDGVTEEVAVSGPTVLGIVPSNADSLMATDETYGEHFAHIQFALEDAERCLVTIHAQAHIVAADRVVILHEGKRLQVYPEPKSGEADPRGEAFVFIKPGAAPRTVLRGDYIIQPVVLSESSKYFGVPTCDSLLGQ